MANPIVKPAKKSEPVTNNLRKPNSVDAVIVIPAPTWEEYNTGVLFTDLTISFFKAMLRGISPGTRVRFIYALDRPTPGNRPPTLQEYDAARHRLMDELRLFKCPILLLGQGGLWALGYERKVSKTVGSWVDDQHFCILNPSEVFKDPFLFRNFRWQFERFIKKDVPPLKVPTCGYTIVDGDDQDILGYLAYYDGVFTFDIEANDLDFKRGNLTAVGICCDRGVYVFTAHALENRMVRAALRMMFHNPKSTPIAHNAKFDMCWLMEHLGIKNREVEDTMLMHGAINEAGAGKPMPGQVEDSAQGHGLKLLTRLFLGWDDYATDVTYNPTNPHEWAKLYGYLALDVLGTWQLYHIFTALMDDRAKQLYAHYRALSETLTWAEYKGVRLDVEKAREIRSRLMGEETILIERMRQFMGDPTFNPNSHVQVKKALYTTRYFPEPLTKQYDKGKLTSKAELVRQAWVKAAKPGWGTARDWWTVTYLEYKKLTKLRSTYLDGLLNQVDPDGYIHTNMKIVGTVTGRSSSATPNLQNIPAPYTHIGQEIRSLFLPDEGHVWISVDLSQAELRVLAYYAAEENMIEAYHGDGDLHTLTTLSAYPQAADLDRKSAEFKRLRKAAKIVNFGVIYGLTAASLMEKINNVDIETKWGIITTPAERPITKAEAQKWIDGFFAAYPRVQDYMTREIATAFATGEVTTPLHHRRVLGLVPRDSGTMSSVTNHLYNYKIQGTAGILTLAAGIEMHRIFTECGWLRDGTVRLTLTVHDEWNLSCRADLAREVAIIAQHVMETTPARLLPDLPLPFASDVEMGYNWGYMKPMEGI